MSSPGHVTNWAEAFGERTGATIKPKFEGAGDRKRPYDEEKARVYDAVALYGHYTCPAGETLEEPRLRPTYRAYMVFAVLWIIFAVVMWLSLPLLFCLVSGFSNRAVASCLGQD